MPRTSLAQSFGCAFSGLWHVVRTGRNARIELAVAVIVVAAGLLLRIGLIEWAVIAVTIGAVIAAEIFNTAVETVVDVVSPEESEPARIAKDASAAAVLVLAMASVVVGLLILGPPLYETVF